MFKKFFAWLNFSGMGISVPEPDPKYRDPSPTELEMIGDAVHGKPLSRSPAQGIQDMQARIKLLTQQKAKILNHLDNLGMEAELNRINQELRDAEARLVEYSTQLEGLN